MRPNPLPGRELSIRHPRWHSTVLSGLSTTPATFGPHRVKMVFTRRVPAMFKFLLPGPWAVKSGISEFLILGPTQCEDSILDSCEVHCHPLPKLVKKGQNSLPFNIHGVHIFQTGRARPKWDVQCRSQVNIRPVLTAVTRLNNLPTSIMHDETECHKDEWYLQPPNIYGVQTMKKQSSAHCFSDRQKLKRLQHPRSLTARISRCRT